MDTRQRLTGRAVAPGIAIGPALLYDSSWRSRQRAQPDLAHWPLYVQASTHEIERLKEAMAEADAALLSAEAQVKAEGQLKDATMFAAHRMLLTDPALQDRALALIIEDGWRAADAITQAGSEQARLLEASGDPEQAARAVDMRMVVKQVWRMLVDNTALAERLQQPAVLVADDIGPAELMSLPREHLLGIVLAGSGQTGHAAILARAWNIPAVIGLGDGLLQHITDGMLLALDGTQGELLIEPDAATQEKLQAAAESLAQLQRELRSQRDQLSVTRDGKLITLLANVSSLAGAQAAQEWGAAGIGSLRTELLFLSRSEMPNEDEQVDMYLSVASELPGLPIVARTLDMGGDKQLPLFPLPREDNPFLGWRGIRIGLSQQQELLLPQIRAMLRAGACADIRLIAPMIATLQEWRQVRALVSQAHEELCAAGIPCNPHPQLGVLIEVPAAALIIEHLAQEADFISIGSNDLVQYTLACDRTNPRVAHLYQPLEPAILQLIWRITQTAHYNQRLVSLCGELASDARLTPLLIGLGIDELSSTPPALPAVRAAVRATSASEACELASAALAASTLDEVRALCGVA